jgi:hypothetical protein
MTPPGVPPYRLNDRSWRQSLAIGTNPIIEMKARSPCCSACIHAQQGFRFLTSTAKPHAVTLLPGRAMH